MYHNGEPFYAHVGFTSPMKLPNAALSPTNETQYLDSRDFEPVLLKNFKDETNRNSRRHSNMDAAFSLQTASLAVGQIPHRDDALMPSHSNRSSTTGKKPNKLILQSVSSASSTSDGSSNGLRSLVQKISGNRSSSTSRERASIQQSLMNRQFSPFLTNEKHESSRPLMNVTKELRVRAMDVRDVPYSFHGRSYAPPVPTTPSPRREGATDDILRFLEADQGLRDEPDEGCENLSQEDHSVELGESSNIQNSAVCGQETSPTNKTETVNDPIENVHQNPSNMISIPVDDCKADGVRNDLSLLALMENSGSRLSLLPSNISSSVSLDGLELLNSNLSSSTKLPIVDCETNAPNGTLFECATSEGPPKSLTPRDSTLSENPNIESPHFTKDTHFTAVKGSTEEKTNAQQPYSSNESISAANSVNISLVMDEVACSSPELTERIMATLLRERQQIKEHYENIDHQIIAMMKQEYNLVYQQYNDSKRENDAALDKIKQLETEVERLKHLFMNHGMKQGEK